MINRIRKKDYIPCSLETKENSSQDKDNENVIEYKRSKGIKDKNINIPQSYTKFNKNLISKTDLNFWNHNHNQNKPNMSSVNKEQKLNLLTHNNDFSKNFYSNPVSEHAIKDSQ